MEGKNYGLHSGNLPHLEPLPIATRTTRGSLLLFLLARAELWS